MTVNKVTYTILDLKMLNTMLFNSFVPLTVATSFETQLKNITCKKKKRRKKTEKKNP